MRMRKRTTWPARDFLDLICWIELWLAWTTLIYLWSIPCVKRGNNICWRGIEPSRPGDPSRGRRRRILRSPLGDGGLICPSLKWGLVEEHCIDCLIWFWTSWEALFGTGVFHSCWSYDYIEMFDEEIPSTYLPVWQTYTLVWQLRTTPPFARKKRIWCAGGTSCRVVAISGCCCWSCSRFKIWFACKIVYITRSLSFPPSFGLLLLNAQHSVGITGRALWYYAALCVGWEGRVSASARCMRLGPAPWTPLLAVLGFRWIAISLVWLLPLFSRC